MLRRNIAMLLIIGIGLIILLVSVLFALAQSAG